MGSIIQVCGHASLEHYLCVMLSMIPSDFRNCVQFLMTQKGSVAQYPRGSSNTHHLYMPQQNIKRALWKLCLTHFPGKLEHDIADGILAWYICNDIRPNVFFLPANWKSVRLGSADQREADSEGRANQNRRERWGHQGKILVPVCFRNGWEAKQGGSNSFTSSNPVLVVDFHIAGFSSVWRKLCVYFAV